MLSLHDGAYGSERETEYPIGSQNGRNAGSESVAKVDDTSHVVTNLPEARGRRNRPLWEALSELVFLEALDGLGDPLAVSRKECWYVFIRSCEVFHKLRE